MPAPLCRCTSPVRLLHLPKTHCLFCSGAHTGAPAGAPPAEAPGAGEAEPPRVVSAFAQAAPPAGADASQQARPHAAPA